MSDKAQSPLRQYGALESRVFIPAFESAGPEVIAFMLGAKKSNFTTLSACRLHCESWFRRQVLVKGGQKALEGYEVVNELSSVFPRHDTVLDLNDLVFEDDASRWCGAISVPFGTYAAMTYPHQNPMPGVPHLLALLAKFQRCPDLIPPPMFRGEIPFFGTALADKKGKLYVPCLAADVHSHVDVSCVPFVANAHANNAAIRFK